MIHYLLYMSKQKDYADFYRATADSWKGRHTLQDSGEFAGCGTCACENWDLWLVRCAEQEVDGYRQGARWIHGHGERPALVLALYVNMVSVPLDDPEATQKIAGEALGEIAVRGV